MVRSELAIVIPAYNEQSTIAITVSSVIGYGCVIVVNDNSTDATSRVAFEAGALVINHKKNEGYDSALNSGFNEASRLGVRKIISFDADGQHPSEHIPVFVSLLDEFDIVVGERPKVQRFSELIFSCYLGIRYNIRDPLCGMKGYTMDLYRKKGCFDSYKSIGTDLLLFGLRNGARVKSVKIPIEARIDAPRFGRLMGEIRILRAIIKSLL